MSANAAHTRSRRAAVMRPQGATANQENTAPTQTTQRATQERRPFSKVAARIQEEQEAACLQAEVDAHQAEQAKKSQCQQEKNAGIDTRDDDELEQHPDISVTSRMVVSKPATLVQRNSRVPLASTATRRKTQTPTPDSDVDNSDAGSCGRLQVHHARYNNNAVIMSPSRSPSSGTTSAHGVIQHSLSPSLAPPLAGYKRMHTYDSDHDKEEEADLQLTLDAGFAKANKINNSGGRPKAGDYDNVGKEVILSAATHYRCLISTGKGFPDSAMEIGLTQEAWKLANDHSGLPAMVLTPDIAKIIKTKTALLVETMYGFSSGQSNKVIKKNRVLVEDLKLQKGYIYHELLEDSRKGVYEAAIIQKVVNAMWFKNRRDEGVKFPEIFNLLPVRAIAFILTAIECCINEWITGVKTDVTFYANEYRSIYQGHIKSLQTFGSVTSKHNLLGRLQRTLYNFGRHHAGAPSIALAAVDPIPVSAFESALKEYKANEETDDEGDNMIA